MNTCGDCKHSKEFNMYRRYPIRKPATWFRLAKWETVEEDYKQLYCILNPVHEKVVDKHICSKWEGR